MRFLACLAILLLAGTFYGTAAAHPITVPHTGPTPLGPVHPGRSAWGCGSNAIAQGDFSVCLYFINANAATNVPSNQSITGLNDNTDSAIYVSTVGLSTIAISWHCTVPVDINKIAFNLLLYGLSMFTWVQSNLPPCTPTNLSGSTNLTNTGFSNYGLILSGVYDASIIFYSANNSQLGPGIPFVTKIISPYNPLTILVLILLLVALVEVYYITRDFLRYSRKLREARQGALTARGPAGTGPVKP